MGQVLLHKAKQYCTMAVPRAARKLHDRVGQQVFERRHRLSEFVPIRLLHRFLSVVKLRS